MVEVGDKYELTIGEVFYDNKGNQLYRVKGFNSLVFDEEGLGRLSKLSDDSPVEDNSALHISEGLVQLLPPDKGVVEKYVDMAVKLKRDINISLDTDGRVEMSLSIPTSYHTVSEVKQSEPETCELCRWNNEDIGGTHCQTCMHNCISHFTWRDGEDEKVR